MVQSGHERSELRHRVCWEISTPTFSTREFAVCPRNIAMTALAETQSVLRPWVAGSELWFLERSTDFLPFLVCIYTYRKWWKYIP